MGVGASSQLPPPGAGHHPLFYKGVKALSEGRYTLSETYFHQAIQRHPGRDFWDNVLDSALPKKHKHIGGFADEANGDLRDAPSSVITEIFLPLDNKFVELHDFARLVSDIAVNYYYKAVALGTHVEADLVRRVGMLYSAYLALRMQIGMLLLHVMLAECTEARMAADELEKVNGAAAVTPSRKVQQYTTTKSTHNTTTTTTNTTDTTNAGNNNESNSLYDGTASQNEAGKPQFSPRNPPPPELLIKILSLKEKCVMMWISSIISYANTALQCTTLFPTTAEGDKSRQKVMTMAWTCVDYGLSVLRNVASVYKNLTTASIFEAYLEEMKKAMNAVGQGSEGNLELGDAATQHRRSETVSFDNTMAFMSLGEEAKKGGGAKHFLRNAHNLNLSMAPLIHTMLIVNVRFRAGMSSGVMSRIPSSLHPVNHSVYHYIDWLLRDLSAAPIYAGKSDFFLRVNKIVMPLDLSDRLALRMLMGEEVLLMSYPLLFLEVTLFRQISRTESIPMLMRRATELVLTTYGGDSAMCYQINELFKKFLGASM